MCPSRAGDGVVRKRKKEGCSVTGIQIANRMISTNHEI
jgi:hypothetical protein